MATLPRVNLLPGNFSDRNQYYLKGITSNDTKILNEIYRKFLPTIKKYILENNGTQSDALDVFQEGLMVVYKKLKNEELQLSSAFQTYLFGVCKYLWFNQLKKKSRKEEQSVLKGDLVSDVDIENEYLELEKQKLFESKLNELPSDSTKFLKLFFNKKSIKEIASIMGYTETYAKRKKYKAKLQLIKAIQADPRYSSFVSNIS